MASSPPLSTDPAAFRPRSYQSEMFEASLKENIIVAMDTGSGKTQIALLRIIHELEHRRPQKLIWFLAPTVALCIQQHEAISAQLPAARTRTLTGLDKVELWTEQAIWDAIVNEMQVIISTHAVLSDALGHGFVKISQLGLVVFDEAHHCMRRHPANKIMQNHYHPTRLKNGSDAVPSILGLTASPVVRSSNKELSMIESNLNAVCKTPSVHRQELLSHTHCPRLHQIWYKPVDLDISDFGTNTLRTLIHAWKTIDIEDDPYIQKLRKSTLDGKKLQELRLSRKTYCNDQLKKFIDRSCHIYQELGGWATDYFIYASIEQVKAKVHESKLMMEWEEEEKIYLVNFLSQIPKLVVQDRLVEVEEFHLSPKLEAFINFLDTIDDPHDFSGLIFATQRATVSVMAILLAVHPRTKHRFRCAAYVGWSGGTRKDVIGELLSMQMQRDTLSDFKTGRKNLIVATDVLEEGIDISACRAVICYNKPPNLKSFVQRRGRARHKESTYAIMLSTDDELHDLAKWNLLEKAMVKAYQDDQRERSEALTLESMAENVNDRLFIEPTGAVLTADTAVSHLHHFCSILPQQPYASNLPEISFEYDSAGQRRGSFRLPNCVHPDARQTTGSKWWKTERAATKDAAFQAYKALHEFGLVNDNLLPLTRKTELRLADVGTLPSIIEVSEQYDPWVDWAYSWSAPDIHQSRVSVRLAGNTDYDMSMILTGPVVLPALQPLTCFWDNENIFMLAFDAPERIPLVPSNTIQQMREITELYLCAPTRQLSRSGNDYVALFGPDLQHTKLASWFLRNGGSDPALDVYSRQCSTSTMGIVRDSTRLGEPLIFKKWVVSDQDALVIGLECDVLPRRRNLLHRQTLAKNIDACATHGNKTRIIPAQVCTIDKLPFSDSIFGLFISAIVDRLEATLVATKLCQTVLPVVKFNDIRHVITAISTPSASGLTNYQRYEFFGDSVLKFTVSCQLFFRHSTWPEGYLSEGRDEIVQNSRLARAALDVGLDAFVMNKTFTPRTWTAPRISEKTVEVAGKRKLSAKVLADVVEALIGAAYMDGGHEKAQMCIRRFLPELELRPVPHSANSESSHVIPDSLKRLVGYKFANEGLLVEALTHPSCRFDASTQSYQRLEFLGDAVLDMVIVRVISQHPMEFPPGEMTKIKHALVNANLLAFLCMEFATPRQETDVHMGAGHQVTIQSDEKLLELWRFMRCEALDVNNARQSALSRHQLLRDEIINSLHVGSQYPWQALSQLNADKFFSDIVESVLGAIFVDSGGDLEKSAEFVESIGLLAYLRRVLSEGVDVVHPRNIAQQISKGGTQFTTKRIQDESGRATYRCVVQLNGVDLVVVDGCIASEEAEVKAANATIDILTKQPMDVVPETGQL